MGYFILVNMVHWQNFSLNHFHTGLILLLHNHYLYFKYNLLFTLFLADAEDKPFCDVLRSDVGDMGLSNTGLISRVSGALYRCDFAVEGRSDRLSFFG